jgi:type II secretory ATPase GspE/PulE/Tfp pilus assembly ATPase PilB-like protein
MGVEPYYVREVVRLIIAQRLVRKLCTLCKEKHLPDREALSAIGIDVKPDQTMYRAVGCNHCNHTGYQGRMGIFEVMPMSSELRSMMSLDVTPEKVKEKAVQQGMNTMWENALNKVFAGVTSIDEVIRSIPR